MDATAFTIARTRPMSGGGGIQEIDANLGERNEALDGFLEVRPALDEIVRPISAAIAAEDVPRARKRACFSRSAELASQAFDTLAELRLRRYGQGLPSGW